MGRTAVVYHSHTGNARKVAQEICHLTGADEVELKIPGTEGLRGFAMFFRLGGMVLGKRRPRISGGRDLSSYDTIILGTPVWAGGFSPALRSLFSRQSLYGMKVGAYFCHKGGLGKAPAKLDGFLNLGGGLKFVDGIEPALRGTARDMAERIAGKMDLKLREK